MKQNNETKIGVSPDEEAKVIALCVEKIRSSQTPEEAERVLRLFLFLNLKKLIQGLEETGLLAAGSLTFPN